MLAHARGEIAQKLFSNIFRLKGKNGKLYGVRNSTMPHAHFQDKLRESKIINGHVAQNVQIHRTCISSRIFRAPESARNYYCELNAQAQITVAQNSENRRRATFKSGAKRGARCRIKWRTQNWLQFKCRFACIPAWYHLLRIYFLPHCYRYPYQPSHFPNATLGDVFHAALNATCKWPQSLGVISCIFRHFLAFVARPGMTHDS